MANQIQIIGLSYDQFRKDQREDVSAEVRKVTNQLIPKEDKGDKLLTRKETADMLKIDKSTLWAWTNKNIVKSYGIGKRIYYKENEILAALTPLNK